MKVSIIIACKEDNRFLQECLQKILKITYADYEIIVLPDAGFEFKNELVKIIPTGPCLPAKKRDIGAKESKGEILAFLDDDAYPSEQWLSAAVKNFKDESIAAVGGPAVTPPTEKFLRRASGYVYESFIVSGNFKYRYTKGRPRFIDDYPSCNLLVRKGIFEKLGGFKTNFWPGEDTVICLEITKKLGLKIAYDPEALVFHHRRSLYLPHLKQVLSYALHRGYFVKRFPETSFKWQYFVPSIFLVWLVTGFLLSFYSQVFFIGYAASVLFYALIVCAFARHEKDIKMTEAVAIGIVLTHLAYGFYFLLGLFVSKLREE